jgi:O-antigen/teichoic acid export membrane protein
MLSRFKEGLAWWQKHPARAGTLAGWFQQGASAFAALMVVPVLMRFLTAEDVGRWFAFQGFLSMANLVDFGMSLAISRQAAYCLGGGNKMEGRDFLDFGAQWEGVARLRSLAEKIKVGAVLVAGFIGVVIFELVLPRTALFSMQEVAGLRPVWYLMMGSSLLLLSSAIDTALLNGLGRIDLTRLVTAFYFCLNGLAIMVTALMGGRLLEMAFVSFLCTALHRGILFVVIRKVAPQVFRMKSQLTGSSGLGWRLFKVAFPVGAVNVGGYLVAAVQVPLLGALMGPTLVAPLYLAQKMGQFLNQAAQQMVAPQLSIFTKLLGAKNQEGAAQLLRKTLGLCLGFIVIANLVFLFFSPFLAEMLAGRDRYLDFMILGIMALDYLLLSLAAVLAHFVMASGKNPFVWTTLLSGVLNLLFIYYLVPAWGVMAVPCAGLITGLLLNYWYCPYQFQKMCRDLRFF